MSARGHAAPKKTRRTRITAAGVHRLISAASGGLRVAEGAEDQAKAAAEDFINALARNSQDALVLKQRQTVDVDMLRFAARKMNCAADLAAAFASSAAGSKTRKVRVFEGEEGSRRAVHGKTKAKGVHRDISVAAAEEAFKEAISPEPRMSADAKVVVAEAAMAWVRAIAALAAQFARNCGRKTVLTADFQSARQHKASCVQ